MARIESSAGSGEGLTVGVSSKGAYIEPRDSSGDALFDATNDSLTVGGNKAHDAVDAGNPVKLGGRARTTDIAAVSSDDRVDAIFDVYGKQLILQGSLHEYRVSGTLQITDNASHDIIAAIANFRIVVTAIIVTNSHASVSTRVTLRDGTGATNWSMTGFAHYDGGGFTFHDGGAPLFPAGASNTAVQAICGTNSSSVDVTIVGYKIPA